MMYVIGEQQQNSFLKQLKQVGEASNKWEMYFEDPVTGQEWMTYYPYSEMHGGGPRLLRHKQVPTPSREWARICLDSPEKDDAIGLAIDMSLLTEEVETILDYVEANLHLLVRDSVRLFLEHLRPKDKRVIIGKTFNEVKASHEEYTDLMRRIGKLAQNI